MSCKVYFPLIALLLVSGCKKSFYNTDDFKSVPKIDSHVHVVSSDGVFEEQAAADNFILITLNVDSGDSAYVDIQQKFSAESAKKHPGKVFFGTTFYFDTAGWGTETWSRKIISGLDKYFSDTGVITVKIWKNIGMTVRDRNGSFIMADDPDIQPVWDFIKSRKLPVTGHLGEPRNCWLPLDQMTVSSDSGYFARNPQYHMYLHPDFPSYKQQIEARDHLLQINPDLTFIGCHLGSLEWNVDSLASRLDRYPNFAVDMSARICHLQYQSATNRERVRNFCIKYQDRLLYGTDVVYNGSDNPGGFRKRIHETWTDDWKYFTTDQEMSSDKFRGTFRGLMLPKKVVDKIYYGNAVKWYKLKV
jgi:predicted TIM-barrel fold metal-dependent hydrolase